MANFQNNAITESGILLRSHVDMGAVFTATKIVIGSGFIPVGKTAKTMTAVVTPVKELTINKKQRSPDGKAIFGGVYTNENVSATFYFRELALYAKAVYPNGTEIAEVLYCYGNAGNDAELMAAYSTNTAVERQMDIVTFVGNEAEVDLTIESGIFMTRKQVEEMLAELGTRAHAYTHAADGDDPITPDMIGAVSENDTTRPKYMGFDFTNDLNNFAGYRSGTFTSATTANVPNKVHPFYDVWNSSGSGRFYTQFASVVNDNITYFRKYYDGIWTGWRQVAVLDFEGDLSLQKAKNGSAHFFKNHTDVVDYGSEIRDISTEGNIAGVSMSAKQQKVYAKFTKAGQSTLHELYHTGNAPAVTAAAELV